MSGQHIWVHNKCGGTGTVWDHIVPTQETLEGTTIPKSFQIKVEGGEYWVHPNATKHMYEYAVNRAEYVYSHGKKMLDQSMLRSFHAAVERAHKLGIQYEERMFIDDWDLIFSKARSEGLLDTIKHAVYMPK